MDSVRRQETPVSETKDGLLLIEQQAHMLLDCIFFSKSPSSMRPTQVGFNVNAVCHMTGQGY